MVGYSIVYLLEEKQSISNGGINYIERNPGSRDIVIKVPVAVPYQTSWDAPEPAEGQIEHEGEFYQMVTRQLINDTLYVHCEFDQNARDQFMNLVSKVNEQVTGNTSESQKQSPSTILKSFLKEYMSIRKQHIFYVFEWSPPLFYQQATAVSLLETYLSIPSPPPDLA